MIGKHSVATRAGSSLNLPFLLLACCLLGATFCRGAEEKRALAFNEFESSCIDLAHYEPESKQLTVRFVNRNTNRFYRYSNVPSAIWEKLKELNAQGGVGEYLNETIVQHPNKFPFQELTIQTFTRIPAKKKPKVQ